jgi:hypothetical protein
MSIVDISPPIQYSFAERRAARLSLGKSRFFLVLGLGSQLGSEQNPLPPTLCTCFKPDALLRVVRLVSKERIWSHNENARICIELKGRQTPKSRVATANRIVSAIGGLFAQVHHTAYHDLAPYQVPRELIKGTEIRVELLERLKALTGREPHPAGIRGRLGSFVVIPDPPMATIFYLLPFVLQNEDLFNACSFFRSCCSEYSLMDGVVGDVLHEPRQEPENESQRLGLENVVLQSFRTIEAVVGEPGNEERFRARLKAWGMDYDERVGFPGRRKHRLGDRIRWLQDARDSAAAHGKRRRRNPFTMFEAMEAQHLADAVLHRVLWFTAESLGRAGDEAEIAFLLAEMFPDRGDPGWVNDRKRFRGKSAIDLARTPGGLPRIVRYRERQARAVSPLKSRLPK